jgi:hypothetical protein
MIVPIDRHPIYRLRRSAMVQGYRTPQDVEHCLASAAYTDRERWAIARSLERDLEAWLAKHMRDLAWMLDNAEGGGFYASVAPFLRAASKRARLCVLVGVDPDPTRIIDEARELRHLKQRWIAEEQRV